MLIARAEGPTRRPNARRWLLDGVLVGVGALRVARELYYGDRSPRTPVRPWDLALWCGVTPPGTRKVLDRLEGAGLVEMVAPPLPGHAPTYRPVLDHPLSGPLVRLFARERWLVKREFDL